MYYKDILKVKDALTKSYYKQLNDLIIQGVTFFSAPKMIEYLQHCINEISSYYDFILHGEKIDSDAPVNCTIIDTLKDEKTKD